MITEPRQETQFCPKPFFTAVIGKCLFAVLLLLATALPALASDIFAGPSETHTTIQDGIDAASDGDVVIVRAGTYAGAGNKDLDFGGKAIVVRSETGNPEDVIIDCENSGRGFHFHSGETASSMVSGISIRNGSAPNGGGILIEQSSPVLDSCVFDANTATGDGGGAYIDGDAAGATPIFSNCIFIGNDASLNGGAVGNKQASPSFINCTLYDNSASSGPAMANSDNSNPVVVNTIIYGAGTDPVVNSASAPRFQYCDIAGSGGSGDGWNADFGTDGGGNFDRPPRFLDEQNKDFHLAGDSPCINAGTAAGAPDHDLDGDPRPLYSRSDVGADEFKGAFSDQDADGLTDFWEYYYFGNLAQGPDGNPDADEYSNMEELQNDTHPNHSEDYIFVDRQNGSSGASGASKLEAKYSIQEGIDAAVDGQTVMVLSGVYAGDCDIDFAGKKIVLRSETNNPGDVIIDCQNSARGFHFHNGETQESVLEAITVKNGAADFGAGAYIENASPTINNCVFATNNATDEGGAAYIDTASPVISGCEFTENTAVNKGGGLAMHNASPSVSESDFSGNTAQNGGGVANLSGSHSTFSGCAFSGNIASNLGGGLYSHNASYELFSSAFAENDAQQNPDGGGGGICQLQGAGIVENSVFRQNNAYQGGGFFIDSDGASASAVLANCVFFQNTVSSGAGAVGSHGNPVDLSIVNSILWQNAATEIEYSVPPTVKNSCVEGSGGSGIGWDAALGTDGGGNFERDPRFASTAPGNWDFHLQADSPCINAGTDESAPDVDFEGDSRPFIDGEILPAPHRDRIDAGVDEVAGPYPDADMDGLPDFWENYHFGDASLYTGTDDPDADGKDNAAEFEEGASPSLIETTVFVDGASGDDANHGRSWEMAKKTIQAGLDAAAEGDLVLVAPGVYAGAGNRDLNFNGKAVVLRSGSGDPTDTIIDCEQGARGFVFDSGEQSDAVVEGLTVRNAKTSASGAGMRIVDSSPTIRDMRFESNLAEFNGGAISIENSSPTVANVVFDSNTAENGGGAIAVDLGAPRIINGVFYGNAAAQGAGVDCAEGSAPDIVNCTFYGNNASVYGGGVFNQEGSPNIVNSILWGNKGGEVVNHQIHREPDSLAFLRRCNVKGSGGSGDGWDAQLGTDGGGNIDADPLFVDAGSKDLHLAGDSPCLNGGAPGGAPSEDFEGDERPVGPAVDIGADEVLEQNYVDTDQDGLPDYWEMFFFKNLDRGPSEDSDEDDSTEMEEYQNNTDPTDGDDYAIDGTIFVDAAIGDDGYPGYSWKQAKQTIQAAIDSASDGQTVLVRSGVYTGDGNKNLDFHGKKIALTSETGDPQDAVIDCENDGRGLVFQSEETIDAVVTGFTVRNGSADYGGGILIDNASPAIRKCVFSANSASQNGGAIHMHSASPVIEGCVFSGNEAASLYGGGLNILQSSPKIEDSQFTENTARNGGGVANRTGSDSTLTSCTFSGNSVLGCGGGFYSSDADYHVNGCFFIENGALAGGGFHQETGAGEIKNTIFFKNEAMRAGGFHVMDSPASATVANCTFFQNKTSLNNDGAVFSFGESDLTIVNSILWNNDGGEIGCLGGSSLVVMYSNVEGSNGSGSDWNADLGTDGGANIDMDPLFVNENGGDFHLSGNSPMINAGAFDSAPGEDFEGDARPVDGYVDIGADEALLEDYIDSDGDGLPDWWEIYYFGAIGACGAEDDPDEDGEDNETEYENRTSPISVVFVDNATGDNSNDGLGRGTAKKTIQAALDVCREGYTVIVLPGTYSGDGNVNLDFKGNDIVLKSDSGDPGDTIIDCNDEARGFYFHSGETRDAVIDGFEIKRGSADYGAGMYLLDSSPVVKNCIFSDGRTDDGGGGGVYIQNGSPIFANCTFSENTGNSHGGAAYVNNASPEFIGCTFSSCYSPRGGAIYNLESDTDLQSCQFLGNSSSYYGGAITNIDSKNLVIGCIFSENLSYGTGGAISNQSSSLTTISCYFSLNEQTGLSGGGAISVTKGSLEMTNSVFYNNTGTVGGAIHAGSPETFYIANCTFYHNISTDSAYAHPGGIVGSTASGGSATIVNSIFWNNEPVQIAYWGAEVSNCAVEDDGSVGTYAADGGGNIHLDPKFVDPDNVDPDNVDLRLDDQSPCIDAGQDLGDGPYADIRGSLRPIGPDKYQAGAWDMGAYEYSFGYSGGEDGVVKAFEEIGVSSNTLIPGYEYEISWRNKSPFPGSDRRIDQAGEYIVNIYLDNQWEERLLYTGAVSTLTAEDYTAMVKFDEDLAGAWKIKIELDADHAMFAESGEDIVIGGQVENEWIIGEEIAAPPDADVETWGKPDIDDAYEDRFFWHAVEKKLYAVGPAVTDIVWKNDQNQDITVQGATVWPDSPRIHIAGTPETNLSPEDSPYDGAELLYSEYGTVSQNKFASDKEGYSVIRYYELTQDDEPVLEVIRSVNWNDAGNLAEQTLDIGAEAAWDGHDEECGHGFVFNEVSPYAPATPELSPPDGYDRSLRDGPITAVNLDNTPQDPDDDLVVVWYEKDQETGICWASLPVRYHPRWPDPVDELVLGDPDGSGDALNAMASAAVYFQNDPAKAGYNPNEEHAMVDVGKLYALRNDLNERLKAEPDDPNSPLVSEPYAIAKFQDPDDQMNWKFRAFKVRSGAYQYQGTAGQLVQPPLPLNKLAVCQETTISSSVFWKDYEGNIYSKKEGAASIGFYYPMQSSFFYDMDLDGTADLETGECVRWLEDGPGATKVANYAISWPGDPVILNVGDSFIGSQTGLEINGQCAVEVVYDESEEAGDGKSVRLLEAMSPRSFPLGEDGQLVDQVFPPDVAYNEIGGGQVDFPDLPPHLSARLVYDYVNHELVFKGVYDDTVTGAPLLLPNIMSETERDVVKGLTGETDHPFLTAVDNLFEETRGDHLEGEDNVVGTDIFKILSAASVEGGSGWVTLAFNNDADACRGAPVSLKVIRVSCDQLERGELKRLYAENVFDERVTFIHSNDFAGDASELEFEWRVCTPDHGDQPALPGEGPDDACWMGASPPPESNYFVLGGAGLAVLEDKWVTARYRGYDDRCTGDWSQWTSPVFYENWIKRVLTAINPFEQRFEDFHENEAATYVSMIQQAGVRYEGDVALNSDPDYLDSIGLIELYTTVLNRGKELSINGTPPQSTAKSNEALLFAASRIADLYMLLANEAYADAIDPTIGFTTGSSEGAAAPSMFCFQNQTASLLQEELELLRGRDDSRVPDIELMPVYNRLIWNFTSGQGQVAYANNYDVYTDEEARELYPQGHGDAWGHYLTAVKTYYDLIRDDKFDWIPRTETVTMKGVDADVSVDFLDERKFAKAAAAKARTGAEIVNLVYRDAYVDDPEEQWQGYKDDDGDRAWGMSEWAVRAGQGTFFDWVAANAVLPDEDAVHEGIQKIDRSTVRELHDIASQYSEIEEQLDRADLGLNPLGLAKDAIPFDIDPSEVDSGNTHFEQIYSRATQVLLNAVAVFDHANAYSRMLRSHQDSIEEYQDNVEEQEDDYNNRLIEIFGYPYPDDIGPGKAYPSGYEGPDWKHYMYVDPSAFLGIDPVSTITFEIEMGQGDSSGNFIPESDPVPVEFHLSEEFGLVKPENWTEPRRAPGTIQTARSNLLIAKADFDRGLECYSNLLDKIEYQKDLWDAQNVLRDWEITVKSTQIGVQTSLNALIVVLKATELGLKSAAKAAEDAAKAAAESLPTTTGAIGGLAAGAIVDATAPIRGAAIAAGGSVGKLLKISAIAAETAGLGSKFTKEIVDRSADLTLTCKEYEYKNAKMLAEMKTTLLEIAPLQYELYTLRENVNQAAGEYRAALAEGERLLQSRESYRAGVADDILEYRYKDMAFRVFRNDAIQKFRAQFDLAAMYAYLAAKAYDYDTGLLGTNSRAGETFMADIVRQRTIGQVSDGAPRTGSGLADQLAQMTQNFLVLKGQMGFNNPQVEENRFSLRKELFRILEDPSSDDDWRDALRAGRVSDLWSLSDYRYFCRPFAEQDPDNPEPAIVIRFDTNVTSGLNFFAWPLGGGDSYYDASRFATKIRSAGVWFDGYDTSAMARTPRIYLVPVGEDIIRVPYSDSFETRIFKVVDQIIPMPFPLSDTQLSDPDWIPVTDMRESGQDFLALRRHSRMRAYPVSGEQGWEAQLQADSRLIGRSVWNREWMLVIPGASLSADADEGLENFIESVTDILFTFQTYSYEGYYKQPETASGRGESKEGGE